MIRKIAKNCSIEWQYNRDRYLLQFEFVDQGRIREIAKSEIKELFVGAEFIFVITVNGDLYGSYLCYKDEKTAELCDTITPEKKLIYRRMRRQ